ncbi:MAG: hypothetical protein IPP40_04545 [bacterium]|nr:hypothetical protein [bacterium]
MRSKLNTLGMLLVIVVLAIATASLSYARDVSATVTYVAWRTLYLDAGRAHGLTNDLDGLLYRGNTLIGELRIAAVAESSTVATLVGDSVIARIGDSVLFVIEEVPQSKVMSQDSLSLAAKHESPRPKQSKRKVQSRMTGRLGFQMDIYDDRSAENFDYTVPGVSTKVTINRVAGENSDVRMKYRGRKLGPSSGGEWQHRLYEASLNLEPKRAHWRANLGRIQAGSIAGIGYIDGGYGEAEILSGLSIGAFAGAQAEIDLHSSDLSTSKLGVLAIYRDELSTRVRTQASLAVAGEYEEGNISREFIYQQLTHSLGSNFSLYESSDFNINRGWKQDAEGATISLANVLVNARYSPAHMVSLSAGYDGRSRYHTWETRETPDSLFDEAIQHGFRVGVDFTMLHGTRISGQQSYRSDPNTNSLYPSGTYSISSNTLLHGRVGAMLRYGTFENQFSTGNQQAASLSISPARGLDLRSEYGVTSYHFIEQDITTNSEWVRVSADLNLRSGWFSSINAEQSLGSSGDAVRTFIELGRRIR